MSRMTSFNKLCSATCMNCGKVINIIPVAQSQYHKDCSTKSKEDKIARSKSFDDLIN